MEYVTGQTLDAWCREHPIEFRGRCELFLKICEAVSYAHRNLVVHRDLKPANIFVTPDGFPKLLDFGIAKLLDADEVRIQTATVMAGRALTLDYASPEQVRGLHTTTATDIYSLGAILYELLSGVRTQRVASGSMSEIERAICEVDPPRLAEGELDAIVSMAMRKEPDRRYQSVEQMAANVRAWLNGWPVKARQGSFSYRAGKYLRRNRTPITVGALLFIALVGGAAIATVQAIEASRERQRAVASEVLAESSRREAENEAREARVQRANADRQRREAELQSELAQTQRLLAERRFDQVHQLSGKFLFDFHDAIAQLPGATPAEGAAAAPFEIRDALASVWSNLGDVKIRAGLVSEAIDPYRHLLELSTGLARETKDPVAAQRRLSVANTKLGDACVRAQLAPQALGYLKVALDIDKRLAAADPNNTGLTRKLFVTYALLGQLLREGPGHTLATPAEAIGYLQGAVDVSDKLAAADPGNQQYLRDIITASDGLAEWLRSQKPTAEAIAACRKGVAAAQGLNPAGNEGLLAQAWQRLAIGLTDSGQYEEALDDLVCAPSGLNTSGGRTHSNN